MKKSIFLIILTLSIISSCAKEKKCLLGGMNLSFQGFDTLNVDTTNYDTITIKSFTKNSLFNEQISIEKIALQNYYMSSTYLYKGAILYEVANYNTFSNDGILKSDKDWEISFLNKVYRINSIIFKEKTQKGGGILSMDMKACYNPTIEYTMNNVVYQNSSDNMVIIQK